jgi:hypothetical protein
MKLAEQAALYYIGVRGAMIPCREVVDWAKTEAEAALDPNSPLAVLSTLSPEDRHGILWRLMLLKESVDHFDALRLARSLVKSSIDRKTISVAAAAKFTYDYLVERYSDIPDDLRPLYDAFDELSFGFDPDGDGARAVDRFMENLGRDSTRRSIEGH